MSYDVTQRDTKTCGCVSHNLEYICLYISGALPCNASRWRDKGGALFAHDNCPCINVADDYPVSVDCFDMLRGLS